MQRISIQDSMTMLVGAACIEYKRQDDAPFVDFALCDKWQQRGALFMASHQSGVDVQGVRANHAYSVLQVFVPQQINPDPLITRFSSFPFAGSS